MILSTNKGDQISFSVI